MGENHNNIVSLLKDFPNSQRIMALLWVILKLAIEPSSNYADSVCHDSANRGTSNLLNNRMPNLHDLHRFHHYFLCNIIFIRFHNLIPFCFIMHKHSNERRHTGE